MLVLLVIFKNYKNKTNFAVWLKRRINIIIRKTISFNYINHQNKSEIKQNNVIWP